MKDAATGEVAGGAVVAVVLAPAGDGVAGGFDVVVDAGLGCGAAGGAGVDVDAEGVEGAAALAGPAGSFRLETMHTINPFSSILYDSTVLVSTKIFPE